MISLCRRNAILEDDGYRHTGLGNVDIAVIRATVSTVGNRPGSVLGNLEVILACGNVLIYLHEATELVVVGHKVGVVRLSPAGYEDSGVVAFLIYLVLLHYVTRNDEDTFSTAAGTNAALTIGVVDHKNSLSIGLATLGTGIRDLTVGGTACGSYYTTLARWRVNALAIVDNRPRNVQTAIPLTAVDCTAVVIAVVLKVAGLIPFVIPVVSRCRWIHSAEDDILNTCGDGTLVYSVAVSVGHIVPIRRNVPSVKSKTSVIHLPVGIRLKINGSFARGLCREGSYGCKAHQQCEHYKKSN